MNLVKLVAISAAFSAGFATAFGENVSIDVSSSGPESGMQHQTATVVLPGQGSVSANAEQFDFGYSNAQIHDTTGAGYFIQATPGSDGASLYGAIVSPGIYVLDVYSENGGWSSISLSW